MEKEISSASALQKNIRQSPRKVRLVVDMVRNDPVDKAISSLKFTKKKAARDVYKVIASAIGNIRDKYQENGLMKMNWL